MPLPAFQAYVLLMVNGRPVVSDGKILTLDEGQILRKAEEFRAKVSASLR